MEDMGVIDAAQPILGETYVELTLHFVYRNDEDVDNEIIKIYHNLK